MDLATPTPPAAPVRTIKPPAARPVCHCTGCTAVPLVQWRRRLTSAELATEQAAEVARRAERYLLRDTQKPDPVEGPMPTMADYTHAVYACGPHAIGKDAAALVHAADCAGPNSTVLPDCGCTPEPAPAPVPLPAQELPAHWTTTPTGSD
jgi:hypothetical protein